MLASADKFASGMQVAHILGRSLVNGGIQLAIGIHNDRNQREIKRLEQESETERKLVDKNIVEIKVCHFSFMSIAFKCSLASFNHFHEVNTNRS